MLACVMAIPDEEQVVVTCTSHTITLGSSSAEHTFPAPPRRTRVLDVPGTRGEVGLPELRLPSRSLAYLSAKTDSDSDYNRVKLRVLRTSKADVLAMEYWTDGTAWVLYCQQSDGAAGHIYAVPLSALPGIATLGGECLCQWSLTLYRLAELAAAVAASSCVVGVLASDDASIVRMRAYVDASCSTAPVTVYLSTRYED